MDNPSEIRNFSHVEGLVGSLGQASKKRKTTGVKLLVTDALGHYSAMKGFFIPQYTS